MQCMLPPGRTLSAQRAADIIARLPMLYFIGTAGLPANLGVLGVRYEPVDRGEVLALCQLLVQAPEHLQAGGKGSIQKCLLRVHCSMSLC